MTRLSGKALTLLVSIAITFILFSPARAIVLSGGSDSGTQNQNLRLQSALTDSGAALLHWTAPGDDHNAEPVTGYDLRYVLAFFGPIDTEDKWNQAHQCDGEPRPSPIGQPDSMLITGLSPGESYYFCIKSYDEANNYSALSNSPLIIASEYSDFVILGDVNNSGRVDGLDVIYLINFLRGGPPIPAPVLRADVNGSCDVNALDAIYLTDYFRGGPGFINGNCNPNIIARLRPIKIPHNEDNQPGRRLDGH
jgi:hypothetical protein